MQNRAPVIMFVYARLEHTQKMITSLIKNKLANESDVWIFSDAAKKETAIENVKKVREYIYTLLDKNYFKSIHIIEAEQNKGLANSVISGVSQVISEYGKVIVLEDDLIVTENFLEYMNEALEFYEHDNKIWSISGYNLPIKIPTEYNKDVYLSYRGCSWGWATWLDRWDKVRWEVSDYEKFKNNKNMRKKFNRGGEDMSLMLDKQMTGLIDSWAIRWCYEQFKSNMYTIYPVKSLVYNEGLDGTGTHSGITNLFEIEVSNEKRKFDKNIELNSKILKEFKKKFNFTWKEKLNKLLISIGLEGVVSFARKRRKSRSQN